MEPSNAWDRAQEAIARAQQRNATVVTPDNAESPYDASATQMIPQAALRAGERPRTNGGQRPPGGRHHQPTEPETTPVEVSDPTLMRPVPAEAPTVRTAATRPPTAPFPAAYPEDRPTDPGPRADTAPTTPPVAAKVPFWKRLFRRRS